MGKIYGTKDLRSDEEVFAILESEAEEAGAEEFGVAGAREIRPDLPGESFERLLGSEAVQADILRHWHSFDVLHRGGAEASRSRPDVPTTGFRGFCVWLNGSSTEEAAELAIALDRELQARKLPRELLDRGFVRRSFPHSPSTPYGDRDAELRQVAFLAELLSRHGIAVIALAGPTHPSLRGAVREAMGDRLVEAYVHSRPDLMTFLEAHELHEDLARERSGSFAAYGAPSDADVVFDTERETMDESVRTLIDLLHSRDLLPTGQEEFVLG